MSYTSFRNTVWRYYRVHGRHDLPWRPPSLKLRKGKEDDFVYKILVSEVMLQQTQVERVIPFYRSFIKKFPTAKKLAAAPLSDVLKVWQGLGYNRRAKMLWEAAQVFPRFDLATRSNLVEKLEKLPGVGPYTARAVAAFAFNQDVIFVETNIRTAVIHHFFADANTKKVVRAEKRRGMIYHTPLQKVSDKEIEKILEEALPRGKSREWYSALMDYGAHLKRSGVKLNAKSKHYAKQSKFEGSLRQVRGAILRALTVKKSLTSVRKAYPDRFDAALAALARDGLIKKKGRGWRIDDTKTFP